MRFRQTRYSRAGRSADYLGQSGLRSCAGFTLAEVLAALLFMAIVIPAAVEGVLVASRASTVAQRKVVAARIAERIINEIVVTGQTQVAGQTGVVEEGNLQYRYKSMLDFWRETTTSALFVTMQILTVEVSFTVQGREYAVQLSTLVSPGTLL